MRKGNEIYRGEPWAAMLAEKNDDGTYVEDLSGYDLRIRLVASNKVVHHWSSEDGTIEFDEVPIIGGGMKGRAGIMLSGEETAALKPGVYTLEVERIIANGSAIGRLEQLFHVYNSNTGE